MNPENLPKAFRRRWRKETSEQNAANGIYVEVKNLDDAIRHQQAVQRNRTFSWALFSVFVPVSLLFWSEAIFAIGHMAEVGILRLLAEFVLALLFTLAAVQMFRAGVHFNRLLANPSRLLDGDAESERLEKSVWSAFLPFLFWSD